MGILTFFFIAGEGGIVFLASFISILTVLFELDMYAVVFVLLFRWFSFSSESNDGSLLGARMRLCIE